MLSVGCSLPRCIALAWLIGLSLFSDFKSANPSPTAAGANATARPNIELAFRKARRDLSPGCSIVCSFRQTLLGSQCQGAKRVKTKSRSFCPPGWTFVSSGLDVFAITGRSRCLVRSTCSYTLAFFSNPLT